jgi:hypothetical protein
MLSCWGGKSGGGRDGQTHLERLIRFHWPMLRTVSRMIASECLMRQETLSSSRLTWSPMCEAEHRTEPCGSPKQCQLASRGARQASPQHADTVEAWSRFAILADSYGVGVITLFLTGEVGYLLYKMSNKTLEQLIWYFLGALNEAEERRINIGCDKVGADKKVSYSS